MMEIAEGVHRLGTKYVNFYVVEEGGLLTLIDTGIPAYWNQITSLLSSIDRSPSDVSAIVQTHYHSDHIGCTELLRAKSEATVFIHELEAPGLRGEEKPGRLHGVGNVIFSPKTFQLMGHFMLRGGMKMPKVKEVETYADDDVLDVPGKPRVLFTPGHSKGHSSLLLEGRGILFAGDALVTRTTSGKEGPSVMELNADPEQAHRSLGRFDGVTAELLLPGHGEPWSEGVSEAVARAREVS